MNYFLHMSVYYNPGFRQTRWWTALLLLGYLTGERAFAQTLIPTSKPAAPFNKSSLGAFSAPSLGDIDSDGDLDALIGIATGRVLYYKNTGTAINPLYTQRTGDGNPFNESNQSPTENANLSPTLGDLDGDGDLDAIIGTADGGLLYYKNVGTAINPLYTQQSGEGNPFSALDKAIISNASPSLGDLDGDGDLDAIIGAADGSLLYYKNTGTAINPLYTQQSGGGNPFDAMTKAMTSSTYTSPSLGDLDGDGDLDAVIGTAEGSLLYFKNIGTAINPLYTQQVGGGNPFDSQNKAASSDTYTSPSLGDIDGDGDLDVIVGTAEGKITYYENVGMSSNPVYTPQTGTDNPFRPDLTPIIFARPILIKGPTTVNVVVNVIELNGIATTGGITLYITKDPMLSLTFDPNAVSLPGHTGSVQNNQWAFDGTSNPNYYVLTTQATIDGQSALSVGLSGQFTPGVTQGQTSVNAVLVGGSGGEANVTNNSDADKLEYFER